MTTKEEQVEKVKRAINGLAHVLGKTEYYQIAESIVNWVVSQKYATDLETVLDTRPTRELKDFETVLRNLVFEIATGTPLPAALETEGLGME